MALTVGEVQRRPAVEGPRVVHVCRAGAAPVASSDACGGGRKEEELEGIEVAEASGHQDWGPGERGGADGVLTSARDWRGMAVEVRLLWRAAVWRAVSCPGESRVSTATPKSSSRRRQLCIPSVTVRGRGIEMALALEGWFLRVLVAVDDGDGGGTPGPTAQTRDECRSVRSAVASTGRQGDPFCLDSVVFERG